MPAWLVLIGSRMRDHEPALGLLDRPRRNLHRRRRASAGRRLAACKLLSENPERYDDAVIAGIRRLLGVPAGEPVPAERIGVVRLGTTVATNALLERKGEPTVLVITKGFADALRIGYQNRPRIFDRDIVLPELLYARVIEADERIGARGEVDHRARRGAPCAATFVTLTATASARSPWCACTVTATRRMRRGSAEIARGIGFPQVSESHRRAR